jgi:hypothetical protein
MPARRRRGAARTLVLCVCLCVYACVCVCVCVRVFARARGERRLCAGQRLFLELGRVERSNALRWHRTKPGLRDNGSVSWPSVANLQRSFSQGSRMRPHREATVGDSVGRTVGRLNVPHELAGI